MNFNHSSSEIDDKNDNNSLVNRITRPSDCAPKALKN